MYLACDAFYRERSEDTWSQATDPCEIFLSHAPPKGYRDHNRIQQNVGCEHLKAAIKRVRPSVIVCGHIHEANGSELIEWGDGTTTACTT